MEVAEQKSGYLRLQIYSVYNILPVILDITWNTQDIGDIGHIYLEMLNILPNFPYTLNAIIGCDNKEQCLPEKLLGNVADFQLIVYGLKKWGNGFVICANSRLNMALLGISSQCRLELSKDWEYYPFYKQEQLGSFAHVNHIEGQEYEILGISPTNGTVVIVKDIPSSTVYVFMRNTSQCVKINLRPATKYSFYIYEGKSRKGFEFQEYLIGERFTEIEKVTSYMTKVELNRLLDKASGFMRTSGNRYRHQATTWIGQGWRLYRESSFVHLPYLYRNKPMWYFEDISRYHGGIMKPYIKDKNGDPASVINSNIDGLFFSAIVDQNSNPTPFSYFGEIRVFVKAEWIFNIYSNIYFADFYCHYTSHYVTLVLTRHGSKTDLFCQSKLLCLDKFNNPFLKIAASNEVYVTRDVGIEVLYTEPINLRQDGIIFQRVETRGRGSSKKDGIPKNPMCAICNL